MPDFLHTCLAARIATASEGKRVPALGRGRDALARLAIALAVIAVLFGSLGLGAGGAEHGEHAAQLAMSQLR